MKYLVLFVAVFLGNILWAADPYAKMQAKHRNVLQQWIGEQKLRPAIQSDNTNPQCKDISGVPYYKVADFSGDGEPDFSVVLLGTGKAYSGKLIVFNGPFDQAKTVSEPAGIFNIYDLQASVLVTSDPRFISFCRCPSQAMLDDDCVPIEWKDGTYQEFIRHYD